MSRSSFMKEIASMGISIFHPRKDRCDICCSFDTGNIGQDEYVIHRQKKDLAQKEKEKEKDKLEADGAESTTKVITVDDFGNLKSIKPGKKATAPNVTNLRALKYTPDGSMFFKTSFADDWELLPLPRNDVIPVNGPDRLYSSRLKIKQSKYDHLQSLKSVLLKDAHAFYDNLPH
ncbi:hypothetical protein RRG08_006582 [Elysia crispata]|uniref:Uncharacterized protein n=1 Tax=Elysia crispata TaxID=231223 RepID=A0AAE1AL59_9GAST|nr:hypothetical protein RRG08_006582 [Elysia crispata]